MDVLSDDLCSGYKASYYKFPISIESKYQLSQIGISFLEKEVNKNFNKIGVLVNEKPYQFFKMLKEKKYLAIAELSDDSVFNTEKEVKDFVNLYWNAFTGLKTLNIVSDICLGNERIIIWKVDTKKGGYIRSFKFKNGLFIDSAKSNKLDPIIRRIYQFKEDGDDVSFSIDTNKKNKKYQILKNGDKELVNLFIDQNKVVVEIINNKISNKHNPILLAYKNILKNISEDNKNAVLSKLTIGGRKKYEHWVNKIKKVDYEAFVKQYVGENKYVLSIINSGNLKILFYTSNKELYDLLLDESSFNKILVEAPKKFEKYSINHVWVSNDEQGIKITNFYYESLVDDFFNDYDTFLFPVILKGLSFEYNLQL